MRRKNEDGFTMVELLSVITIMGILIAASVFALSGARRSGAEKACSTDLQALRTANEAFFAKTLPDESYGNEVALRADGVLPQLSTLHDVTVGASTAAATAATNAETSAQTGVAYVIKVQSATCGTLGQVVG